jgi:hypothetical protein
VEKMEKKNLVQIVGSFVLGAALATGIGYLIGRQPVQKVQETLQQLQETRIKRHYQNPYFAGVYDRIIHQGYGRHILHKIKVDKEGDGKTDEVIVFKRKNPGVILSENNISIYEGDLASDLLPDDKIRIIPLSDNLPTSEDYKKAAKAALEKNGYPSEMIDDMKFKEFKCIYR